MRLPIITMLLCSLLPFNAMSENYVTNSALPAAKKVRILSIDGGGVRGIIPAYILAELETKMPLGSIAENFDIIAGTSVGGIISLMLVAPGDNGKPKYSAAYILDQTEKIAHKIFKKSIMRNILTGYGAWSSKYSASGLEEAMYGYFAELELKDTLRNVIVPAYSLGARKAFFFKNTRAQSASSHNCKLWNLATATSSAPTYFPPHLFSDSSGRKLKLVDGGVAANNPTLAALIYAKEIYGNNIEPIVLSIGTGSVYGDYQNISYAQDSRLNNGISGWITSITDLLMSATNDVTDYQMYYILNYGMQNKNYLRLQALLKKEDSDLDNINKLPLLKEYAKEVLDRNSEEIEDFIAKLN